MLFSLAVTSTSIHDLWYTRESEEHRKHCTIRIRLLEDTVRGLRAGGQVNETESGLIRNLATEPVSSVNVVARDVDPQCEIDW